MRQWVIKAVQASAILLMTYGMVTDKPEMANRIVFVFLINVIVVAFATACIWSLSGWVQRKILGHRGAGT
jgi:hypothetical protein